MSKPIVGVDIGSVSARAVELRHADRSKPIVTKFAEVPLPEGSVRRGEVLEIGTIAMALRRLWALGRFSTKDVVLGMGGPRVISRDLSMPRAPLPRIREALPFHVQELLPAPVSEMLMDFYPISTGNGEQGSIVNGLLVAAVKDAVTANVEAVTRAGLHPVQVDLIPFALVRALSAAGGGRGLTALAHIGANTTNVVMVQDGVPQFVRITPQGGDDITRALVKRLQLTPAQAEQAKREFGFASANAGQLPVSEIVYEVGGELVTSIQKTLSYYTSTKPGSVIDRIALGGGGGQLVGLANALKEITGIPVAIGDPPIALFLGKHQSRAPREQLESMTTAFALALGSVA